MTNEARARGALAAVDYYSPNRSDEAEGISDLLCDLRHLCDMLGLDFLELVNRGNWHYAEELAEGVASLERRQA
jgi:hypothetical protein